MIQETNIKQVFKEKNFPAFIKNNAIFKKYPTIKKIFPEIGLENCSQDLKGELDCSESKNLANSFLYDMSKLLINRIHSINEFCKSYHSNFDKLLSNERKNSKAYVISVMTQIKNQFSTITKRNRCIHRLDGKINLYLHSDVSYDGKIIFKAGQGIFRVYNKINEELAKAKFQQMVHLDDNVYFKLFSSSNVSANKAKICFSSTGTDGLWDIATMSMRGIQSCQGWKGEYKEKLVGSLLDPFTGVIYLTSGASIPEYGSKMIRRCVVRFLINKPGGKKRSKPIIGIERMYPDYNKEIYSQFIKFIAEKINNKYKIILMDVNFATTKNYVPLSESVSKLEHRFRSYTDSGVYYGVNSADDQTIKYREKTALCDAYANTITSYVRKSFIKNKIKSNELLQLKVVCRELLGSEIYDTCFNDDLDGVGVEEITTMLSDLIEAKDKLSKLINICIYDWGYNYVYSKNPLKSKEFSGNISPEITPIVMKLFKSYVKKIQPKITKKSKTLYAKYL